MVAVGVLCAMVAVGVLCAMVAVGLLVRSRFLCPVLWLPAARQGVHRHADDVHALSDAGLRAAVFDAGATGAGVLGGTGEQKTGCLCLINCYQTFVRHANYYIMYMLSIVYYYDYHYDYHYDYYYY